MGWRLASLGRAARQRGNYEGTYTHAQREFVDQIMMHDFGTNAFRRLHTNDALSSGVRIEAIEAIRAGREEEVLIDEEKVEARFVRGILARDLDDETWDSMEEIIGTQRGTVELAIFVGLLQLILTLYHAFGLPPDSDEEVQGVIDRFKAGEELPSQPPGHTLRIRAVGLPFAGERQTAGGQAGVSSGTAAVRATRWRRTRAPTRCPCGWSCAACLPQPLPRRRRSAGAAARDGVDGHGGEQHERGDHVLDVGRRASISPMPL